METTIETGIDIIAVGRKRQVEVKGYTPEHDDGSGGDDTVKVKPIGPLNMQSQYDQPAPITNSTIPVWDLVIADMRERDHVGRQRYGTPLQTNNGRDALVDAYQEALDLAVYLRQAIEERKGDAAISRTLG